MNLAYFKERFNNTESAPLLARRANNPGLNPFARQAIEQIINERGEPLPPLIFKNNAGLQGLKETKADKFWRFTAIIAASISLIVILQTCSTGFIQDRAAPTVWSAVLSTWLLLWLRKQNAQAMKAALRYLISPAVKAFQPKVMAFDINRRTCFGLPLSSVVIASALSYYVILPNIVTEPKYSENWYVYGLIFNIDFENIQKKLAPHKIRLVSGGCLVGGDQYQKAMQNNQVVYESATDDLKQLLEKPRSHLIFY
jgi:hypothetical protein